MSQEIDNTLKTHDESSDTDPMPVDSFTIRDGHPCEIWQGWRHVGSVMQFEDDLLSDDDYREQLNDKQKVAWDRLVSIVD